MQSYTIPVLIVYSILVDIVVHTASSMVPKIALHLIRSLGRRRKATGNETYFIHVSRSFPLFLFPYHSIRKIVPLTPRYQSSVLNLFSIENMWPYGEVRDTDSVFEKEKQLGETSSVRAVSCWFIHRRPKSIKFQDYILTSQETNILVVEEAKSQGVTAFNVPVPTICELTSVLGFPFLEIISLWLRLEYFTRWEGYRSREEAVREHSGIHQD